MPRFVAILRVHERVRSFVARCQAQEPLEELQPLLIEVVGAMPGHFAEEEAPGGFFEDLLQLGIVSERAIEHLRLDHIELKAQADDLVTRWNRRTAQENRRALTRFADALGAHERVETHYADGVEALAD